MNHNYIIPDKWSIIENSFDKDQVTASESLFSIGNGYMGQRANFEETYSGETLQGSYIGGIYYPDKTRVGWWKNGYPEYFAKVLNAPNWIGINIKVNNQILDLNKCIVTDFYRELNMKEGWLKRSFTATLSEGEMIKVESTRFISFSLKEVGAIKYDITALNFSGSIEMTPYLDAGIENEDSNYDEYFWEIQNIHETKNEAYILSRTLKTAFDVCTGMKNQFLLNGIEVSPKKQSKQLTKSIFHEYTFEVTKDDTITLYKYAGYSQSMNHPSNELDSHLQKQLHTAYEIGFKR